MIVLWHFYLPTVMYNNPDNFRATHLFLDEFSALQLTPSMQRDLEKDKEEQEVSKCVTDHRSQILQIIFHRLKENILGSTIIP